MNSTSLNMLRAEVLQAFKNLHKVRKLVFKDDSFTLQASRNKINDEFKRNKHVEDPSAVHEVWDGHKHFIEVVEKIQEYFNLLIQYSNAVAKEMKTTIVQAHQVKPGTYELRITSDTVKLENVPFKDCPSQT